MNMHRKNRREKVRRREGEKEQLTGDLVVSGKRIEESRLKRFRPKSQFSIPQRVPGSLLVFYPIFPKGSSEIILRQNIPFGHAWSLLEFLREPEIALKYNAKVQNAKVSEEINGDNVVLKRDAKEAIMEYLETYQNPYEIESLAGKDGRSFTNFDLPVSFEVSKKGEVKVTVEDFFIREWNPCIPRGSIEVPLEIVLDDDGRVIIPTLSPTLEHLDSEVFPGKRLDTAECFAMLCGRQGGNSERFARKGGIRAFNTFTLETLPNNRLKDRYTPVKEDLVAALTSGRSVLTKREERETNDFID